MVERARIFEKKLSGKLLTKTIPKSQIIMNKKISPVHLLSISIFMLAAMWSPSLAVAQAPGTMAEGGNSPQGYDMAPETKPEVVAAAVAAIPTKLPDGPFKPTWDSLKANYKVPQWFAGSKFGLFMHWGLYSVPAHHNEWYEKHMYGAERQWHAEHFGM